LNFEVLVVVSILWVVVPCDSTGRCKHFQWNVGLSLSDHTMSHYRRPKTLITSRIFCI